MIESTIADYPQRHASIENRRHLWMEVWLGNIAATKLHDLAVRSVYGENAVDPAQPSDGPVDGTVVGGGFRDEPNRGSHYMLDPDCGSCERRGLHARLETAIRGGRGSNREHSFMI